MMKLFFFGGYRNIIGKKYCVCDQSVFKDSDSFRDEKSRMMYWRQKMRKIKCFIWSWSWIKQEEKEVPKFFLNKTSPWNIQKLLEEAQKYEEENSFVVHIYDDAKFSFL